MNINLPSPSDLRKFQLESYAEMYKNPRSFEHKIFLRKQIKQLNEKSDDILRSCSNNNPDYHNILFSEK
jgi:hypothetical protein